MTINEDLFALLVVLAIFGSIFLLLWFYTITIEPILKEKRKQKEETLKKEQDREELLKKLSFDNIQNKNNILALEFELKDLKKKVGKK